MPIDTSTSSARAAKFEAVGDKIEGTILSADAKPQTDIDTGEIKTWSDGNPILQWVIVLATSLREDADDDGNRTVYAKGGKFTAASGEGLSMMEAIKAATAKAGASQLLEGGTLLLQHTGLGEKKKAAYSAPKLYKARYTPPAKGIDVDPFAD